MKLHWIAGPSLDPEAGHEQHYVIAAVGGGELGELLPCCLGRVVYCVYVVFQGVHLRCYVDLSYHQEVRCCLLCSLWAHCRRS